MKYLFKVQYAIGEKAERKKLIASSEEEVMEKIISFNAGKEVKKVVVIILNIPHEIEKINTYIEKVEIKMKSRIEQIAEQEAALHEYEQIQETLKRHPNKKGLPSDGETRTSCNKEKICV